MITNTLPTTETLKLTGADYANVFEADFNPNTSKLSQGAGISDRTRSERVIELHRTLHKQRWEKATVINMHPFDLRHGMGNIGEISITKKKDGAPYTKYVIETYKISIRDLGDAKYVPEPVLPAQMAEDVCLAFKDYGGVFWYRGDGEPDAEEIYKAGQEQLKFYQREFQTGLDSWSRHKQMKFITEHAKTAAKELFRLGLVNQLPEWMTVTRSEAEIAMCESCGEAIKKTAKKCKFCGFAIDAEWVKMNKNRFDDSFSAPRRDSNIETQPKVDYAKEDMEAFMKADDPLALSQLKNLDDALSISKDTPDEFKNPSLTNKSDIHPLNKGKK